MSVPLRPQQAFAAADQPADQRREIHRQRVDPLRLPDGGQPAPFLRLRHGLRHSARRAAADFRPVRQTQLLQTGHGTRASDLQKHRRTSRRRDRREVGRRARHDLLVHASLRHRQALRNPVRGDPDGFGRKGQTDDPHCRGQRQQLPSFRNDPAPRLPADTRPGSRPWNCAARNIRT